MTAMPFRYIITLGLLALCPTLVQAAEPVSKSFFGGVAIGGMDAVAYHQLAREAHAVPGDEDFTVRWKGAKWRFSSRENAATFEADPTRYEPAYNGHCANALSLGKGLVKTDGAHWLRIDDRLYLFYASEGRQRWLSGDYPAFKVQADAAWRKIVAND